MSKSENPKENLPSIGPPVPELPVVDVEFDSCEVGVAGSWNPHVSQKRRDMGTRRHIQSHRLVVAHARSD
jgi:hypothetical protein